MSEQQAMMSEQTVLWSDKLQVAVKKLVDEPPPPPPPPHSVFYLPDQ